MRIYQIQIEEIGCIGIGRIGIDERRIDPGIGVYVATAAAIANSTSDFEGGWKVAELHLAFLIV